MNSKENTTKSSKANGGKAFFIIVVFFLKQRRFGFAYVFEFMALIAIGKRRAKEYLLMNLQKSKGQNGRKPVRKIVKENRFAEKQTSMY